MKVKSMLIILALFVAFNDNSNAQVGGLLKKGLNKALNKSDTSAAVNEQSQPRRSGVPFGGKTDIKYDEEYTFTGRIFMQMEVYDKKNVSSSDYYTYFNPNSLNAGIEVRITDKEKGETSMPTIFLFDNNNKCFMILIQGEDSKTGIISTIPDDSTMAARTKNQKYSQKPATVTRTGNSKIIAGYRCDEYKVVEEGEEGYANVWMTKDVKINADKRNWGKSGMPSYYNNPEFEGSMMLAMESYDKENNLAMKMETKEINENYKNSISTAGYSFLTMNFMQAGKK